mmetsp:Transcript_31717/g.31952  ORF Transcript_31717/g.31952 Transcript_31717/m.31952 type:complete len:125 (+) Transcript_31717:605-979(+)
MLKNRSSWSNTSAGGSNNTVSSDEKPRVATRTFPRPLYLELMVLDHMDGVTCSLLRKHHQGIEYLREVLRIYEPTFGSSSRTEVGMLRQVLDSVGRILPATEHPKILHVKKTLQLLESSVGSGV